MTKEEYFKTIDSALQMMCDTANSLPFGERLCWWKTLFDIAEEKIEEMGETTKGWTIQ